MDQQQKVKKKLLVTELKNILKNEIKMDEDQLKKNNEIVKNVLDHVLSNMQTDPLFKILFRNFIYTGSSYEGLRIKAPTEFDIDLVLDLPFKKEAVLIECGQNAPSYVKYKLKKPVLDSLSSNGQQSMLKDVVGKWFDKNLYLETKKVIQWMQGVLDRKVMEPNSTFTRIPGQPNIILRPSSSGPARTLHILVKDVKLQIDVDLVPVLKFAWPDKLHPEWPPGIKKDKLQSIRLEDQDKFWLLVPKPYKKGHTALEPTDADVGRLWRLHFPEIEKKYMHNKQSLKPAIKLMKLLRDKENWCQIASYHLKTVGLWQVFEHPQDEYWKEDNLGQCLIELLRALEKYVERRHIPYFFDQKWNLLKQVNASECDKIQHRVHKIIVHLEEDPVKGVSDHFKTV